MSPASFLGPPADHATRLERAWQAGLFDSQSELWGPEVSEPEKLCGLLLRTGVGMEGLEAVATTFLSTTDTYGSLGELERDIKLPSRIDQKIVSGEVCNLSPRRRRTASIMQFPVEVSSFAYVRMLDGTVQVSCFRDPVPATSARTKAMEEVLAAMRQIPWGPERHAIFPWWFQQRIRFLAWVGEQLGLQPVWCSYVLPFLSVEAVESPQEARKSEHVSFRMARLSMCASAGV